MKICTLMIAAHSTVIVPAQAVIGTCFINIGGIEKGNGNVADIADADYKMIKD